MWSTRRLSRSSSSRMRKYSIRLSLDLYISLWLSSLYVFTLMLVIKLFSLFISSTKIIFELWKKKSKIFFFLFIQAQQELFESILFYCIYIFQIREKKFFFQLVVSFFSISIMHAKRKLILIINVFFSTKFISKKFRYYIHFIAYIM